MTHRERFHLACSHQPADRVVFDLCGSPQTLIDHPETRYALAEYLGLSDSPRDAADVDERVLKAFDIDTRRVGGMPTPTTVHCRREGDIRYDSFGIGYRRVMDHEEICVNPLREREIDEILAWPLPEAKDIDPALIQHWARQAQRLHETTDYAIVAEHPVLGVFELACWMFGFDDWLYRLAAEPETVHAFSQRYLEYQKQVLDIYYDALGRYIDCTTSGDDFGTQTGPFMSKAMFDDLIKPYLAQRIAHTKKHTDAFYQHHTCGSVYTFIPSLIQCGVDILNPIQPGVHMMEPERLKAEFGDQIVFWGGVDTQHLLPRSTREEIIAEVQRLLSILGQDGGYVLAPAHCIQKDVPAPNIAALYEGAHAYYKGV